MKWLFLIALVGALGCGDDVSPAVDSGMGTDAGGTDVQTDRTGTDTTSEDSSTPDTPASTCREVSLGEWSARVDDVSATLEADLTEPIEGQPFRFRFLWERYAPGPDIGTFTLGEGDDANFGNCRHCVFISPSTSFAKTYFATEGTLEQRTDPYSLRFDLSISGLVLREVTVNGETRESTLVPGGDCIRMADFGVQAAFPGPGWTCDVADYVDGELCHCNCGDFDPDCSPEFLGDPIPPVDCPENTACGFDTETLGPACIPTCDWAERTPCAGGEVCIFDDASLGTSFCTDHAERFSSAMHGEECAESGFQQYCAIEGQFANGYCDAHNICRPICDTEAECTIEGESCQRFIGDEGFGFCGPPPPKDG